MSCFSPVSNVDVHFPLFLFQIIWQIKAIHSGLFTIAYSYLRRRGCILLQIICIIFKVRFTHAEGLYRDLDVIVQCFCIEEFTNSRICKQTQMSRGELCIFNQNSKEFSFIESIRSMSPSNKL